jgi:O-antigen ligase
MLFAASSVALISGINLPASKIPLFTLFALVTFVVSAQSIVRSQFTRHLFVPPLLIFIFIHLLFAFRPSISNGLLFVLQTMVVGAFVVAFANRYSQIGMARYLRLTGFGMMGLLAFVVGYHLTQGVYTSYKLLDDPKAVFVLVPLMLLVLRRSSAPAAKVLLPLLLPVLIVITLLSGERKAYMLLALVSPFLLNFRSLSTYMLPLVLALAISAGLSLDRSGYVERQLNTFSQLAQGSTTKTISDDARSWALQHATQVFVDNPIIGVGTNGYGDTVALSSNENKAPHNEWLRVAADNGVVGLIFFAATLVWGFVGILRTRVGHRVRTADEKIVSLVLFATLLIYLSFEAFDLIVLTAFILTPLLQFLRLDPNDACFRALSVRRKSADSVPGLSLGTVSTTGDYIPTRDQ